MPVQERRRHPRYPCDLTVDVQPSGAADVYRGQLADICLGGCYISMVTPLAAGVTVLVHFRASEQHAALMGKTVTSLPGSGMGIEFIAPTDGEGSELLRALVEFLDDAVAKEALR
jgi:PilZ domain